MAFVSNGAVLGASGAVSGRRAACGRSASVVRMGFDMEQSDAERKNRVPSSQLNTAPLVQVNYVGPKALDYATVSVRCPPMERDFGYAQTTLAGIVEKEEAVDPAVYAKMGTPMQINMAPVITFVGQSSVSVILDKIGTNRVGVQTDTDAILAISADANAAGAVDEE